ncbi:MAG: hypothetical protein KY475_21350 [Planctomycetes bacterium]|nr:hypothetical protein [Planctomycetota bacterium]
MVTQEQIASAKAGEEVALDVEGVEMVLVRRDVYERSKHVVYDDSDFDPEEAYPMIEEVLGDDPGLDAYQEFKRRP